MARPTLRLCIILLAYSVLFWGCTVAAEPLFFDCHGTFDFQAYATPTGPHPQETTDQIMIDLDRGIVKAPVVLNDWPGAGTSQYCAREYVSNSGEDPAGRGLFKMRSCLTLQAADTAYSFRVTYESFTPKQSYKGQSVDESRSSSWATGSLNRITGKFHGAFEFESKYLYVYDLTCVPAQRKF
jgi:hypothetical protein